VSQPNLPPPLSPDTRPLAERIEAVALPAARGALAHVALSTIEHYVAVLDLDGTVLEINDRGFVPLPPPAEDIIDRALWDTAPWAGNPTAQAQLRLYFDRARGGTVARETLALHHRDTTGGIEIEVPVEVLFTPVVSDGPDGTSHVAFIVIEAAHVAERHSLRTAVTDQSRALAESEARFRALAESTSDLVCLHSPDGVYQYASPSVRRLLGYEPDELVGTHPIDYIHPDQRTQVERRFHIHTAAGSKPVEFSYRIRRRGGAYTWFETVITPIVSNGQVVQLQSSSRDITERKRTEEELVRLAFHDELTGLPNRALALDRIGQALAVSRRTNQAVGVLFIDLDGFKVVNDTIGHYAGDATLVAVAERLTGLVRPGDTLARLGGDEFVMLCPGADGPAAAIVARRVLHALGQPFTVYGRTIDLTASIGIAISQGADDPMRLVENADTAMYDAKRAGRDRFAIFDPDERTSQLNRLATEFALRRAVERNELLLHYQPEIDLASGRVVGVEALVRWQRDDGILVPPGEFIPLAEETGLIIVIGRWVIEEACRQVARWEAQGAGPDLRVWVNVSARQLGQPDLVPTVQAAIRAARIRPQSLCLEITESALMEDAEAAAAQLDQLRSLGISLGVDDFGTGYSSLAYLNRFPLDVLKIDRSFVARLDADTEAETIVAAIIDLAHALDLVVIAEGVETEAQLAVLRRLECDQAVGFYFSKPLPAEQLTVASYMGRQ
jgi:diguanylate cyclase (GGDEF)-like protein/PAS domain S-box-containing protein